MEIGTRTNLERLNLVTTNLSDAPAVGGSGFLDLTPIQQRFALAYDRGFYLFPLAPGKKTPMPGSRGFKDATRDPKAILDWPTGAGVGIATGASGLLVIDCDAHTSEPPPLPWDVPGIRDGEDALAYLWHRIDPTSEPWATAPIVSTPSGGVHIYLEAPVGGVPSSAGKLAWQVDIRAQGGYVVAPGTVLYDGGTYTPVHWPSKAPEPPQWLCERLTPRPAPTTPLRRPYSAGMATPRAVTGILRAMAEAQPGKRNDVLNWAAYKLAEKGVATANNLEKLAAAAEHAGLHPAEITRTITSATRGAVAA